MYINTEPVLEHLSTVSSECSEGPAEAMGNSEQNDWVLTEEWKDSTGTDAMSQVSQWRNLTTQPCLAQEIRMHLEPPVFKWPPWHDLLRTVLNRCVLSVIAFGSPNLVVTVELMTETDKVAYSLHGLGFCTKAKIKCCTPATFEKT